VPFYPARLEDRFGLAVPDILRRLRLLEVRTAVLDSGFPLMVLPGVISGSYSGSGDPEVYVNGSTTLTGPYQHLASYTPAASDTVLLVPVPALQSYVVIGKYE
jgi:hypothetical protein